jgi:hypothetical protein
VLCALTGLTPADALDHATHGLVRVEPLWELLGANGRPVGVVGPSRSARSPRPQTSGSAPSATGPRIARRL